MKLFKNFLYNVLYQVLIMILPLITAPYIARVLGAEKIGIYSYTYSIAYYFVLFGQLGLNVYGNRTIATVRDNKEELSKTFWSIYLFQFIISFIACICYIFYVMTLKNTEYKFFSILQFIYVVSCVWDINWFYFGIEKFKLTVTRNTIIKIMTVILILLMVKSREDLWIYIIIMSVGTLIGQLILWTQLPKYIKFTKCTLSDCKEHIKPVVVLFLPTIATSLYRVMDKIMLGSNTEMSQLGYYENSEKFISISMGVINALGTVMIPQMSNLVSNGNIKKVKDYINKSMEGIFILAVPIAFGLAGIANILSVVFYGKEFGACGNIISILAISIIFSAWANVIRTQYLVPNKRDKEYIISMFTGAITNLIINIILIPKIGAIGAAIGTVIAELSVAVMHSIYAKRELPLLKYLKMVAPYFIIGLTMYIILRIISAYISISINGLILEICAGVIIYLIIFILYTIISRSQYYYIIKNIIYKKILRKDKVASE